jgi:hypothetical protein
MKKVIIVSPTGASGGQEALHQLCDAINSNTSIEAFIHYHGPGEKKINNRFKEYNIKLISKLVDDSNTLIVIPEIFAFLVFKVKRAKVGIYWLSIDGFFLSKNFSRRNKLKEFVRLIRWPQFSMMPKNILHFCQSKYAYEYLNNFNIGNLFYLSDYTKSQYISDDITLLGAKRNNIICYNPKKGYEITSFLKQKFPDLVWLELNNMTPDEISSIMKTSKIYIDFGNHPGKDRFPREAASSGLIIITGRSGSANYYEYIPISDTYKLDNPIESYQLFYDLVIDCFSNYEMHFNTQCAYRENIRNETNKFINEINFILSQV